jgi:hypothetical protein
MEHVRRQRELVEWLRKAGHDTSKAAELLHMFEQTQALHVAHRDRLRAELPDLGLEETAGRIRREVSLRRSTPARRSALCISVRTVGHA